MIDSQILPKERKQANMTPLIQTLKTLGWNVNPLITVTVEVRGVIHKQSLKALEKLKLPPREVKKIMKHIHQIGRKYLTYVVPNKRKFNNNQTPVDMPHEPKHPHLKAGSHYGGEVHRS